MTQNTYLNVDQAAEVLQLSASTLAKMRLRGDGPPYTKSGHRRVLYGEATLYQWLADRLRVSTSEP